MKIKSIQIKGLWNTYDINWNLNDSVNILSGINGSGKSTIFSLLSCLLSNNCTNKLFKELVQKVHCISIVTDEATINMGSFHDKYQKLKQLAEKDGMYDSLIKEIKEQIEGIESNNRWDNIGIEGSVVQIRKGNKELTKEETKLFFENINMDEVSTFDSYALSEDNSKFEVHSLNFVINSLLGQYSYYIESLTARVEEAAKSDQLSKETFDEIYSQRNKFVNIINEFLETSGKEIKLTNKGPKFVFKDSPDTILSYKDLSSGEKQILLIMLHALLQEQKECIFFLDEPEISLHTDWQMILIDKIRELNPNCQLLIVTHAPSLIMNRWIGSVQNLEDIRTVKNA